MLNMWKDWLYFSGRERNGIFVLLGIMLLLLAANIFVPRFFHPKVVDMSDFEKSLDSLIAQQKANEPVWLRLRKENEFFSDSLQQFNPNTIDSAWMYDHGFGTRAIKQLMAYRNKGGTFRVKNDFEKLYAISKAEFKTLKPFVALPDSITYSKPTKSYARKTLSTSYRKADTQNITYQKPVRKIISVELNTADTLSLQAIYGIGPSYAKRIIGYRKLLGGYIRKSQLLEVYGLKQESYDLIKSQVSIDSSYIRKIAINRSSVARLKAHPYLNFYQAKAIVVWLRNDSIKRFDDIYAIPDLDTSGIWRLNGYFDYDNSRSFTASVKK